MDSYAKKIMAPDGPQQFFWTPSQKKNVDRKKINRIKMVLVLLSASVEGFSIFRMRNFSEDTAGSDSN